MKYTQKIPFGFTKLDFDFGDKKLNFLVHGEKFDTGFSVLYKNIRPDKSLKTITEKWPLYVARVLWAACLVELIMDKSLRSNRLSSPTMILLVAFCLMTITLVLLGRWFFKRDSVIIKTHKGNILVLEDEHQKTILTEIYERRKAAIRRQFAEVDTFNDPAQELAKFRKLKEESIISESEFNAAIAKLSLTEH